MRRLAAALVLALLVPAAAAVGAVPVLRDSVVVDDDLIRLGDLFDGIGERADVAVAPAPRLGRRGVYDATWLLSVARAHDLAWRPQTRFDRIVVKRASHAVSAGRIEDAVEAAIAEADAERGRTRKIRVELDNPNFEIHVPPGPRPEIAVRDLRLNGAAGRFSADIAVAARPGGPLATSVSGRVFEIVEVPVLQRSVPPGEVISKADLEWVELRSDMVRRNSVVAADEMVGKTPRRRATPGVPLRRGDLRTPVVVRKGSLVTMVLETRAMQLTAQGRAVEDGAQGAVIKVMNTQSRTVVEAVVEGPSRVAVATPAEPR